MFALLSTCASVSWAPVAGMLGGMKTRCSPTIIYLLADIMAATSAAAIWQWFTCCCQLLSAWGGLSFSDSWGPALEYLDLIPDRLEVLLCDFGENHPAISFLQQTPCLNLLPWLIWWGLQEVCLPVVWRCNFKSFHASIDLRCKGSSQHETLVSPRYSNMVVWSVLLWLKGAPTGKFC